MKRIFSPWLLLSALLVSLAAHGVEAQNRTIAQQEESEAVSADVKVGIDPKTGKLRPLTAAESSRLSEAARASAATQRTPSYIARYGRQPANEQEARLTKRTRADGSVAVRAPASLMNEITASFDENGNLVITEGDSFPPSAGEDL